MACSCVCRVCGKASRYEGVQEVVAVLDNHGNSYPQQKGDVLKVNWLKQKQPFDFDEVEIIAATDEQVEEFVRQTRFDSDIPAQKLRDMPCQINTQCRFQRTNTMTILEQIFGNVTRE